MMFPIGSGKTEINLAQIVSSQRAKGGETWTLYMTDDKTYVVTKGEYAKLRKRVNPSVRVVCTPEQD